MADPLWLVSVHDVMPDTIGAVRDIVRQLDNCKVAPITLLVVPGGAWTEPDIDWLRERQGRGDQLAGHGWIHRAAAPKGLYDRLHRQFFSRGVAEHLPLSAGEIAQLISDCHDWFVSRGLAVPGLYVPPAWAMGRISREQLRALPFRSYETLTGIYHAENDRFQCVPLLGFEADTVFRALSLRLSNVVNQVAAKWLGQLRVAIHPHDLQLHLRDDLLKLMAGSADYRAYN